MTDFTTADMRDKLRIIADLPPRPIGTRFTYKPGKAPGKEAEIIGYKIEHVTDTGKTTVTYRIAYEFMGQQMTYDVFPMTVERALGGKG